MGFRLSAFIILCSVLWTLIFSLDKHEDRKRLTPSPEAERQLLIEQCRVLDRRGLLE